MSLDSTGSVMMENMILMARYRRGITPNTVARTFWVVSFIRAFLAPSPLPDASSLASSAAVL